MADQKLKEALAKCASKKNDHVDQKLSSATTATAAAPLSAAAMTDAVVLKIIESSPRPEPVWTKETVAATIHLSLDCEWLTHGDKMAPVTSLMIATIHKQICTEGRKSAKQFDDILNSLCQQPKKCHLQFNKFLSIFGDHINGLMCFNEKATETAQKINQKFARLISEHETVRSKMPAPGNWVSLNELFGNCSAFTRYTEITMRQFHQRLMETKAPTVVIESSAKSLLEYLNERDTYSSSYTALLAARTAYQSHNAAFQKLTQYKSQIASAVAGNSAATAASASLLSLASAATSASSSSSSSSAAAAATAAL